MSTPTIANANSSDFLKSEFFNMLQDIDYPVYHGDDESVDPPSAAPPADMSSTNDEMQFDFDELEAMIDMPTNKKRDIYKPGEARPTYTRAPRRRRPRPRRPPPAAAVEAEALLDLEPLVADGSGSA